jgi:bromodomain-containing protein 7/9
VQITRCNCAELGIPHYFACVSEAMDLTTMSEKLYGNLYKSVDQFAEDVRRIASNAKTFNPPGGPMFLFADRLLATLDDEIRKIAPRSTITEEQKG